MEPTLDVKLVRNSLKLQVQGKITCTATDLTNSDAISVNAHFTLLVNYSCIKPHISDQGCTNVLDRTAKSHTNESRI